MQAKDNPPASAAMRRVGEKNKYSNPQARAGGWTHLHPAQTLNHANIPGQCKPRLACVQSKARARRKTCASPSRGQRVSEPRPAQTRARRKTRSPRPTQRKPRPTHVRANARRGQRASKPRLESVQTESVKGQASARPSQGQGQRDIVTGRKKERELLNPQARACGWTHPILPKF